ncbi:hypothetical protein L1765_10305 [Microaerobacter geothermalis]|uniref:hypothetical protein n=1 Tax=Microaerobacter geothermalis TaxID=674972 RepID=UPI001F37CE4E|nr:hypothetical protein [Microaerobacter geothermalis]MCF6094355.1 hypothetical protein [Microaerobacter geothermalis]
MKNLFANETGYQTTKIDVRGVVSNENKVLMVQESHLPSPYHVYKIFIRCEIIGGSATSGMETKKGQFFPKDHEINKIRNGCMSNTKRFFKLFSKNLKESLGPGQYEAEGIKVVCPHCNHDRFKLGKAQLNTALLTFFNLDFANRSADTLMCERCGNIQWFGKNINRV